MTSSIGTSPSLIANAKSMDNDAWSRLVAIYTPLIQHWCRQWDFDFHESHDIAQDTLLAAAQGLPDLRLNVGQGGFRGWLWRIARNKMIDHRRRPANSMLAEGGSSIAARMMRVPEELDLPTEDPSSPEMCSQLVQRALSYIRVEFEESSWRAFWRTVVDGLTSDAVATELGVSAGAVRQARSRILRRLRQELGDR